MSETITRPDDGVSRRSILDVLEDMAGGIADLVANGGGGGGGGEGGGNGLTNAQLRAEPVEMEGIVSILGTANVAVQSMPAMVLAAGQSINIGTLPTVSLATGTSVNIGTMPNVTVAALPAVSLAANQTLNIGNMPDVSLATGTTVGISGSVTLATGQSINIGTMPSVMVAGLPAITVAANQTIGISGTVTLASGQTVNIGTLPNVTLATGQSINIGTMPAVSFASNQTVGISGTVTLATGQTINIGTMPNVTIAGTVPVSIAAALSVRGGEAIGATPAATNSGVITAAVDPGGLKRYVRSDTSGNIQVGLVAAAPATVTVPSSTLNTEVGVPWPGGRGSLLVSASAWNGAVATLQMSLTSTPSRWYSMGSQAVFTENECKGFELPAGTNIRIMLSGGAPTSLVATAIQHQHLVK